MTTILKVPNTFTYFYTVILAFSCVFLVHTLPTLHHVLILSLIIGGFIYKYNIIMRKLPVNAFFVSRLFFIVWALLSYFWATYYGEFFNRIVVYMYCFFIIFLTYILFDEDKYIRLFFKACTISGFFLSLYVLFYTGQSVLSLDRLSNDAMSINTAATKFAYIVFMQVVMYYENKKRINLVACLYFFIMVLLTGSKTGFFMVMTSGVVFLFSRYASNKDLFAKIKVLAIVFCVLFVIFEVITNVPVLYQIVGRRIYQLFEIIFGTVSVKTSYSTYTRLLLVTLAWDGFLEKPLTGWGENNMIFYNQFNMHAHSSLMEILFDFGIIGFLAYFYQYFCIFKEYISLKAKSFYVTIAIGIAMASIVEIATSISHNDLLNWLMVLFSYILIRKCKQQSSENI